MRWTPECSVARNKICEVLARKMTLKIPEEDKEFRLYVDADERGMSVVVAQELEGKDWPVAFLSRLLRQGEECWSQGEMYIGAIRWAVEKFKWYVMSGGLVVYLPEEELGRLFRNKDACPKVKMLLLDLELYKVEFRAGRGAWAYS